MEQEEDEKKIKTMREKMAMREEKVKVMEQY